MTLANLLSVDQIVPELRATERWDAIDELLNVVVRKGLVGGEDRESIFDALKSRENNMSTGIGLGIAIPHATSDRIDRVVAAFGRSRRGIEFGALDNAPVRFVVMFVVPKDQFQIHLRTLAAIAKFLNDRGIREKLATAESSEEILQIFQVPGR
jgi:mannitol/fructose-specific phosphotransferase system IIA component (Ntr-type)